jgi:hypothetical protein
MTPPNPFDHAPDERLGQLLRAHLAPPEDAAFTARVLARLGAREDSSLDVLARAGIAAALILALAATAAARASATATAVADDGLLPSAETMLASATSTR